MDYSILVAIRGRNEQAATVLPLLASHAQNAPLAHEIVVVESDTAEHCESICRNIGAKYLFDYCIGPFHKSRLLNIALKSSSGNIVIPYDIDLIPFGQTARLHLELATSYPRLLFSGFRLMTQDAIPAKDIQAMRANADLAPENSPSAIRKWLVDGERFGIAPHFWRSRLEEIGGWDPEYIGWGAEDQDVIERYLGNFAHFVPSPDLLYLHLQHSPDPLWTEAELKNANTARYYAKRLGRSNL